MNIKTVPYKIKHYGNIDKNLRLKKYLWYTANDKDKDVNAILGDWQHYYRELYKFLAKVEEDKKLNAK
jgi:hypothetical protein